jgi:conjugative relaxase-like TrwC/TraI family protein
VEQAHEDAVDAAISYLEDAACLVRRGRGGRIRIHGVGLVGASFRHRTSRAGDPLLHTHVVTANMTST